MGEAVAPRVGAEHAHHRVLAEQPLERLQDEGGLAVGVEAVGPAVAVGPGPPRHHVRLAALAQARRRVAAAGDPHARRHHRPAACGRRGRSRRRSSVAPALGAERVVGRLRRHVAVEALVEPGLLELVVGHEPVPELVPGLVDRDALRALQLLRGARRRRRPVNSVGYSMPPGGRAPGRVDHRDLRRRDRAPTRCRRCAARSSWPRGSDRRGARARAAASRRIVHRRVAGVVEARAPLEEAAARGPGEVVDVLLHEAEGLAAVRVVGLRLEPAGGAHHEAPRQREPHVVDAEVGEELRPGVEGVAVPLALPEHADLGEPLRDEVVVVHPARAADAAVGDARVPLDAEAAPSSPGAIGCAVRTSITVRSSVLPSSFR